MTAPTAKVTAMYPDHRWASTGVPVVVPQPAVVGDQGHEGPRHAEQDQDDVEGQVNAIFPSPRDRIGGDHLAPLAGHVHPLPSVRPAPG